MNLAFLCPKFFSGKVSIFLFLCTFTVRLPDTPPVSGRPAQHGGISQQHPHASAGFVTAEQVQDVPERGSAARLQHL